MGSGQSLHCLPIIQEFLDSEMGLKKIKDKNNKELWCPNTYHSSRYMQGYPHHIFLTSPKKKKAYVVGTH